MGSYDETSALILERYHGTDFENMGKTLLDAMSAYVGDLEKENLPLPSLEPASLFAPAIQSPRGVTAKAMIVDLAQKICAMTMDPQTNLLVSSLQFHFCSCLKVAIDLRIYDRVPQQGVISAKRLATAVGAEETLLIRIMRVLTTKFVFAEPKPGFYTHTGMSCVLARPNMVHLLSHRLDEVFRSASREADALAKCGYKDPRLGDSFGFNIAFDTSNGFWDYVTNDDPARGYRFDQAMPVVNMNTLDVIPEIYPFDQLLQHGGVIVDVGGGMGQVAQKILSSYPDIGLRCIVQDFFATNATDPDTRITTQRHDFFEEQPVKGASAYFFRHIFHDWPDDACVTILRQTAQAMNPDKSRILICDQVVSDTNPSAASVLYDIDMMTLFGGKERTLAEWDSLLDEADPRLYIVDVKSTPKAATTILEVRCRE